MEVDDKDSISIDYNKNIRSTQKVNKNFIKINKRKIKKMIKTERKATEK